MSQLRVEGSRSLTSPIWRDRPTHEKEPCESRDDAQRGDRKVAACEEKRASRGGRVRVRGCAGLKDGRIGLKDRRML